MVTKSGVQVAKLKSPTLFGELAAISPAPRNASVTTQTPCRALIIPREALYTLMLDEQAVVDLMVDLVVRRLVA